MSAGGEDREAVRAEAAAAFHAPLPHTAEVVVVGGGASGSSIAHQLAKRGVDVLLLEAGDLAQGASGRNGGLIDSTEDPASPLAEFYLRAARLFPDLSRELAIDFEYSQDGNLSVLLDEAEVEPIRRDYEAFLAIGYPVRWLSAEEALAMSVLFPENTLGGMFKPEDGHCNPILLTYAYADAAVSHGAKVRQYTEVTGLRLAAGKLVGVDTADGPVGCEQVVIATEPWSRPFLEPFGLHIPVTPQRGQIFVTEPLPPLLGASCIYSSGDVYIYWRQTRHGGLTIGGCRPVDTHGDWLLGGPSASTSLEIQKLIVELTERVHPTIGDVSVIRWWGGVMGFTPDNMPILGRTERWPNLITACGFCTLGMHSSPLTGRVIADVVTGREPEVDISHYRLERFAS